MSQSKDRTDIIYTRTGDRGSTTLSTGERVAKSDPRVAMCGEVDELNSCLGMAVSLSRDPELKELLRGIQHRLMGLAGKLHAPSMIELDETYVSDMEREIDRLNRELDPIKFFILPGGAASASACHLARTVCRRIERNLVARDASEPVPAPVLQYFNRLADLLFVVARSLNQREGVEDVRWEKPDFV